jgi:hypothetical protein
MGLGVSAGYVPDLAVEFAVVVKNIGFDRFFKCEGDVDEKTASAEDTEEVKRFCGVFARVLRTESAILLQ